MSSVQGILEADSATVKAEIEALANTWDGEARIVSKWIILSIVFDYIVLVSLICIS